MITRAAVDRLAYWRMGAARHAEDGQDDLTVARPAVGSVAWMLWLQRGPDGRETAYGEQCRRAREARAAKEAIPPGLVIGARVAAQGGDGPMVGFVKDIWLEADSMTSQVLAMAEVYWPALDRGDEVANGRGSWPCDELEVIS